MIKSMTGFGRSVMSDDLCDVKIEMKSVNSKYMDVNIRLPRFLNYLEVEVRNVVKDVLKRCKVDVFIEVKPKKALSVPKLNKELLNTYMTMMNEMKSLSGIQEEITIDSLMQFKDLVEFESDESFADEIKGTVISCLKECLAAMDDMRASEGVALIDDINARLDIIADCQKKIESNSGMVFDKWFAKFKGRVEEMDIEVNEERLIQEASVYAEKADITEEAVRIISHLKQIRLVAENEYPCGKKLDFLSQELHREFNTIGSKSGSVEILNDVVSGKSEIDKIREQIQNIV